MSRSDGITRSRIFDGLSEGERRAWLERARVRACARGDIVARQGEPARELSLVDSGFLKIVQLTPQGQELIVRFVGPNEPFGGVVALDGAAYPVTAIAVEPTRLHVWSLEALRPLLEQTPQVRVNLMREMATHMTEALTRVRELATARVGTRLASALIRLMRQCGRTTAEGVALAHSLTRQELADLTGTTLYTVSRTLSQWTDEGILRTAGRRLTILDARRLEAMARKTAET
jgi:CRP/FNR family transcriptional regulator, nitrogen oxide reductase regulator